MANETVNYKRTVAGSIGAGVGAIFNGSGRTYYILEHKTASAYHQIGESQKIIIDQIELGRDPSCQVRFDAETVSRKHAAIVRDGQNWQLIHLSQSNPTLVNGRPIQGQYYLQSGDEIQLSVNGPRLGFIVPQGKQALTSSIRLTERMNLFRQQALTPYRRAIWALTVLLILAIAGFGTWTYILNNELKEQTAQAKVLQEQVEDYDKKIKELDSYAEKTPELEKQIAELKNRKQQVVYRYQTILANNPEVKKEIEKSEQVSENVESNDEKNQEEEEIAYSNPDAKSDLRDYYPYIYRIIIEDITLERNGIARSAGISTDDKDCGTGFILSNGTFVTARQNIQPWLYINGVAPTGWKYDLAIYAAMGFEIKMKFAAYSTSGPAQKIEMSSRDFDFPTSGDVIEATVPISKSDWQYLQSLGFDITKEDLKRVGTNIKTTAPRGRSYALYRGTGRSGIPSNNGASQSLPGGKDIEICGYTSNDIHNLAGAAEYYKASTSSTDTKNGTIRIQDAPSYAGHLGAPAFIKEDDGTYTIIGVYVGSHSIVPISKCQ